MRLKSFLAKHLCCFCGGDALAETMDHVPPKSVFREKKSPECYVFPACSVCNGGSSDFDALFVMTSRFDPLLEDTAQEQAHAQKQIDAFIERQPVAARSMIPSVHDVGRLPEEFVTDLPESTTHKEVRVVKVTPEMNAAIKAVGRKLIQALHYKHTGIIVPLSADVELRWYSNVRRPQDTFPKQLLDMCPEFPVIRRDGVLLTDQFAYRFGVFEDGSVGVYAILFRSA